MAHGAEFQLSVVVGVKQQSPKNTLNPLGFAIRAASCCYCRLKILTGRLPQRLAMSCKLSDTLISVSQCLARQAAQMLFRLSYIAPTIAEIKIDPTVSTACLAKMLSVARHFVTVKCFLQLGLQRL